MATELYMVRKLSSLVPSDRMSEEALRDLPEGVVLKAVVTSPRNLKHHKKYMALLQVIFPHQRTYPTFKSFRSAIACALGYGDSYILPDGRTMLMAQSISFAKMDQTSFDEFYKRAVELILTKIVPGVDSDDLEREVNEILEGRSA